MEKAKNTFKWLFFASLIICGLIVVLWVNHLKYTTKIDELRLKNFELMLKNDSLEIQLLVRDNLIDNLHRTNRRMNNELVKKSF